MILLSIFIFVNFCWPKVKERRRKLSKKKMERRIIFLYLNMIETLHMLSFIIFFITS